MTATTTSRAAYHDLKAASFHGQHAAILTRMRPGVIYSRRQIAKMTGLETSAVAGRINELLAYHQVIVCGTLKCPISNKHVEAVKLAEEQMELA